MNDSMHVYRYVYTHVPAWVQVCLSVFLHKHLAMSENVSVFHESPETSVYFCICIYMWVSMFLHFWGYESVNTVWMAYIYIHICIYVCVYINVYIHIHVCIYNLCFSGSVQVWNAYYSVPTHLHVSVWVHMCICVYTKWLLLGLWVLHSYLCKHVFLAVALRMYGLWD